MGEKFESKHALTIVALIFAIIIGIVLWNDTIILPFTYDKHRPTQETTSTVNSELVSAYRMASRKAVEDYFGKSVTDDYIYCYAQSLDGGLFYYCIVDGTCYRFTIYGGSAIETYDYILYNTSKAPDPGMDNFNFTVKEAWLGGLLFASIEDA